VKKERDEPLWLDPEEAAAWQPFVVAGMHLFAELDRDLRAGLGITLLDHGILLMLRAAEAKRLTMGHLAEQFGVEPSVITYRVQRMEPRRLARRERDSGDRRQVWAFITASGERLCDAAGYVHVPSVRRHFLDHVPRETLPAITRAFEGLYSSQHALDRL